MSAFPFPFSDKPCELYCSPLGKESPLLVADRVLDGTPCGPYETDLCVHGKCQVMCFPCVFGGAFSEGEASRRFQEGAEAPRVLGGMDFLQKVPVVLSPAAWDPSVPQQ